MYKLQLVPERIASQLTSKGYNSKKYIVIHQTGNTNTGANAQMHADLQSKGNSRKASWHETIDDKEVIQSFSHDTRCWHAGDGSGKGNYQGIGIELCINADGNYEKTIKNGVKRVQYLMGKYSIPIENVIMHFDCSRKKCPKQLIDGYKGITWHTFKEWVSPKQNKVDKESSTKSKTKYNISIVDYLNSNGKSSSFDSRKKLAESFGIDHYAGTSEQNIELLNYLKQKRTVDEKKNSTVL